MKATLFFISILALEIRPVGYAAQLDYR